MTLSGPLSSWWGWPSESAAEWKYQNYIIIFNYTLLILLLLLLQLQLLYTTIYSNDGKAEFSAATTPGFSVSFGV